MEFLEKLFRPDKKVLEKGVEPPVPPVEDLGTSKIAKDRNDTNKFDEPLSVGGWSKEIIVEGEDLESKRARLELTGLPQGREDVVIQNNYGAVKIGDELKICTTALEEGKAVWLAQVKSRKPLMANRIVSCGVVVIAGDGYSILMHGGNAGELEQLGDLILGDPKVASYVRELPPKKLTLYSNPNSPLPRQEREERERAYDRVARGILTRVRRISGNLSLPLEETKVTDKDVITAP